MTLLLLFNRQKKRKFNLPLLRRIATHLLTKSLAIAEFELGVHLIDSPEMAGLNENFLGHTGSTDVITFNHQESKDGPLHGEIFISVPDAIVQSSQFGTSWQSEVVRYLAHGILHLQGHDDTKTAARRVMKREENKLVKELSQEFHLGKLGSAKNASKRK